jgi:hypothetical protein
MLAGTTQKLDLSGRQIFNSTLERHTTIVAGQRKCQRSLIGANFYPVDLIYQTVI